jgi:putative dehydrogenase
MNTVAIVGVGNMGGGMARRLLSRGWNVRACDIDPARLENLKPFGALALSTPGEAAINSVATIVCVVDADQAREVLFGAGGAAEAMQPGQAVVLCPTISPQAVESLAAALAGHGLATIDAPMSGGPARALDGTMSLMVACEDAVFERNRPLL